MSQLDVKNILVAGPNGSLGKAVLSHLERTKKFRITLLTRDAERTKHTFPDFNVVQANYDDPDALTATLTNDVGEQDALVVLLNRDLPDVHIRLIDAAVAAGITHIIPSCFGFASMSPEIRALPPVHNKAIMQDHVVARSEAGDLTFTGIQTGAFLDWALERGLFLNAIDTTKPTVVFDGGNISFSASIVDDIGKAVTSVLIDAEKFRNRFVTMHSAVVTQNKLLAVARELVPGREFETTPASTAETAQMAWSKYNAGDRSPAVMSMFLPRAFGLGEGLHERVDNEELGVEVLDDDGVKRLVARFLSA